MHPAHSGAMDQDKSGAHALRLIGRLRFKEGGAHLLEAPWGSRSRL